MEERNILWGELIGGLLIVGFSIALVISLWKTLEHIPYSPFLVFAGITAALFGAGLYTLHHWKLEATSRGLLLIATLLVPLNFLVLAGLQRGGGHGLLEVALDAASLALFAGLIGLAGRVLVPGTRWLVPMAVLGGCLGQLLLPWVLTSRAAGLGFFALALLPVACHGLTVGAFLRQHSFPASAEEAAPSSHRDGAVALLVLLGTATFALAVAHGFLVYRASAVYWAGDLAQALERVAPFTALAGITILAAGLRVHHGLAEQAELSVLRTAGTAVALTGMAVMLASVLLAWPVPAAVLLVGSLNVGVLTWVAFRHGLPVAHAPALGCLVLSYLTAWHWALAPGAAALDGRLLSAENGTALAGLFILLLAAAEIMARRTRGAHALFYAGGSGCVAALSLVLVTISSRGIEQPGRALALWGAYGGGGLIANVRWRRPLITSLAWALLVAATLWDLRWQQPTHITFWGAVLAGEALATALLAVGLSRPDPAEGASSSPMTVRVSPAVFLGEPLARSGEATALLAILMTLWGSVSAMAWSLYQVVAGLCLMLCYLLLSALGRRRGLARLAGCLMTAAAASAAGWWAQSLPEAQQLQSSEFVALLGLAVAVSGAVLASVALTIGRTPTRRASEGVLAVASGSGVGSEPEAPARDDANSRAGASGWYDFLPGRANSARSSWYGLLSEAWLQAAMLTGVVGVLLTLLSEVLGTAPLNASTFGVLGLTALLVAWGCPYAVFSWIGSGLVLSALIESLAGSLWNPALWQEDRLGVALLAHASLMLLLGLLAAGSLRGRVQHIFARPLVRSALASSFVSCFVVLHARWGTTLSPVLCLLWLAGLWLVLSWARRLPMLFGGFQAVLCLAVLFGTTAWLETQPWFRRAGAEPSRFWDPWSLQAYGMALGCLSLLWAATRLGLRRRAALQAYLDPAWPAVDCVVLAALVIGQAVLAWLGVLPAIAQEIFPAGGAVQSAFWPPEILGHIFGSGAWLLLGLLAVVLVMGLWGRWRAAAALGLVCSALTGPVLAAGWFVKQQATVPWLCWGLGVCFLACSLPLWARSRLSYFGRPLGWPFHPEDRLPVLTRGLLLAGAAGPVLVLTFLVAASTFSGEPLAAPLRASFFGRLPYSLRVVFPLFLVCTGLVGHALRERSPGYAYSSGLVINLAGGLLWLRWGVPTVEQFVLAQALCFSLASCLWSMLELRWPLPARPGNRGHAVPPFRHMAVLAALVLLSGVVISIMAGTLNGMPVSSGKLLPWLALAATAVALALGLWDAAAVFVPQGWYALGLLAIGLGAQQAGLRSDEFARLVTVALAAYVGITVVIGWALLRARHLRKACRLPERAPGGSAAWFLSAQAAVASAVVLLSLGISIAFDPVRTRLTGPLAAGLLVAAGLLAGNSGLGSKYRALKLAVLTVAGLTLTELGWALLDPAVREPWLHRSVVLMVSLAVATVAYGVGLARGLPPGSGWRECGRRLGPVLGALASATLLTVLMQEAWLYVASGGTGAAFMAPPAVVIVVVALAVLIVSGLTFAVMPGQDPFGLSERGRSAYVYAAELLLVLIFVHLRLTAPGLFHWHMLAHHWPFVVMALAFTAVGLSEIFSRMNLRVLAEPLERTGVFLPLLPVLAYGVLPGAHYALVWFLAGLLYGFLAIARRSFRLALAAALAANIGLWVLLHAHQLSFVDHPQVWLIPTAVILLIAEHLNRDRLDAHQSAALRYLGLIIIYVASTADMFRAGLGESWALPLVLAVLSVIGILLGMVLRVRAFLFLGSAFLLLVVATLIWHAGVDLRQSWILWSSGIALGVAILVLFGVFEKRRKDVLRLVEELKQWR